MNPSEKDCREHASGDELVTGLFNVIFCLTMKVQKLEKEIASLKRLDNDHHHIREAIETLHIRVSNLEMNQPKKTKRRK